ncbi:MATE family efflux transporter [Reinekea thalattae]|uniref:Multidrug-efflux transporter n=1 Tax=Reinekea thalattae TaxID=2593301 RepID=A0A5C8ZDU9_9GAMM|nr:MATE family efflux transporter [Reinekea thalattae]
MDESHQPLAGKNESLISRIKKEWSTLAVLGAPILIGQLAQIANGVIDTLMAGRASAEDLSGVAIGNSLWVPLFLFMMGLLNSTQPIISGHRGAKQFDKIMPVTWNAFYIALIAAAITIALLTHVSPVLNGLDMEAAAADITVGYLNAFVWGVPAVFTLVTLRGLTDGLGKTKIFMAFSILSACINAPLNYIFIFGKFGMPELGGVGCGWATAIANWASLLLLVLYLNRAKAFEQLRLWQHRTLPNRQSILEIIRLGIPIGFTIFVEATMFSVVALLMVPFGSVAVAGHQIALNVTSVLFMVPLSLGFALTLRISFLLGAQQPKEAKLAARSTVFLAVVIALFYCALLLTFSRQIAGLYSHEADVIAMAAKLISFAAMFQVADSVQVSSISALRGYRDTKIPMFIMISSFWIVGIPLGYILANTNWLLPAQGPKGFWIGLILGLSHAACWLLFRLITKKHKLAV